MYSAKIKNSKAFFGIEKKICLRVNSFSFRNVTFDKEEFEIKTRLQSPTCFQSGPARRKKIEKLESIHKSFVLSQATESRCTIR